MNPVFVVRNARPEDAQSVDYLLREWLTSVPVSDRMKSIGDATAKKELLVAESDSKVVGFIHFAVHDDIFDGAPNSFISSFYVTPAYRGLGVGSALLDRAIADSAKRGVVAIEISTTSNEAREFYERRGFKQSQGNISEAFLELDIV